MTVDPGSRGYTEHRHLPADVRWHLIGTTGEPAFQSGWSNYPSYEPASYAMTPDGEVWLKGLITGGTLGYPANPAFTLPLGFRIHLVGSSGYCHFPCLSNLSLGVIVVSANGTITPHAGDATWFDLATIHYLAR